MRLNLLQLWLSLKLLFLFFIGGRVHDKEVVMAIIHLIVDQDV